MAYPPQIETDPLGHRVIVEGIELPPAAAELPESEKVIAQVIRKPALLIEISGTVSHLYFYRSVNWSQTLLIGARRQGEYWTTFSCVQNPSSTELSELLRKGKQLI